jgi:hypothetical protein
MYSRRKMLVSLLVACLSMFSASTATADEGMWLFNCPPKKLLKERYNFDATDEWLLHLQRSSLRTNHGSASFVSPDGLVMTNHHVGAGSLQELSTKDRNLLDTGFYARTPGEELKCPASEFDMLVSIEDVTDRVNAAVGSAADSATAERQRRAAMNTIEKESFDATGLRSDVVTLYNGGLYHLYRYKKYTDVRLVFAPEQGIAFFGGDADNFEYPRYDLDICFFRVYEDGKPAKTPQFLKWNPASLAAGDLVFVSGNPGHTDRLKTVRHLEFIRDCTLPSWLDMVRRREVLLMSYCQRSAQNSQEANEMLLGCQNGRKARLGGLAGLQDPAIMNLKRAEEKAFRKAAKASPHAAECDAAFVTIDKSLAAFRPIRTEYEMLEGAQAFHCTLFTIARTLVRLAEENEKPNADRLRELRESNLDSLRQSLFSEAPIYPNLEIALLADSLSMYLERTGECAAARNDKPVEKTKSSKSPEERAAELIRKNLEEEERFGGRQLVEKVMAGKSPERRAAELVRGTKLADVAVRRQLAEGGRSAIEASHDPMILLARLVDEPARQVRTIYEQQVEEPQRAAYGKLANIRFALFGKECYPDATFTLRLSIGTIKGYDQDGRQLPVWTDFAGLYRTAEEHRFAFPFNLAKVWLDRKGRLKLDTPLNFLCTNDIIGGNSGSPVVNRAGELVGIAFDGNIESLVWDYIFSEEQGRSIAVHGSAILESLRKVYAAAPLADELTGR